MNDNRGSFDFGSAFDPEPWPGGPQSAPPPQPVFDPNFGPPAAAPTVRRGQPLAWISVGLAAASALAIGIGLYAAVDSIRVPIGPGVEDAKSWLNLVVAGFSVALVTVALAIVALVRSRPRTVATIGLVAALVLPPIALIIGFKVGLDSLLDHATQAGNEAADILTSELAGSSDKTGGLVSVLLRLLQLFRGD